MEPPLFFILAQMPEHSKTKKKTQTKNRLPVEVQNRRIWTDGNIFNTTFTYVFLLGFQILCQSHVTNVFPAPH